MTSSDPVNLGAPGEISIRDLAQCIGELCGYTGTFRFDASKPAGQPRRSLDCEKAKKLFGFRAQTSLRDGLQRTIEWTLARREQDKLFPQVSGRSMAPLERDRSGA